MKPTTAEIIALIKAAEFRKMTHCEESAFGGIQTDNPLVAEVGNVFVILDGEDLHIIKSDTDEEYGITLIATLIANNDAPFIGR